LLLELLLLLWVVFGWVNFFCDKNRNIFQNVHCVVDIKLLFRNRRKWKTKAAPYCRWYQCSFHLPFLKVCLQEYCNFIKGQIMIIFSESSIHLVFQQHTGNFKTTKIYLIELSCVPRRRYGHPIRVKTGQNSVTIEINCKTCSFLIRENCFCNHVLVS